MRTVLLWPLHSRSRFFGCVIALILIVSVIGGRVSSTANRPPTSPTSATTAPRPIP